MAELTEAQQAFMDSMDKDDRIPKLKKEIDVLLRPLISKYVELSLVLLEHSTPELLGKDGPVVILDPLITGLMLAIKTSVLDVIDPGWQTRALEQLITRLTNAAEQQESTPPKKHLH